MKRTKTEDIKIVYVEIGKAPEIRTVKNDIGDMQELVGGYIQVLAEALPYYVVFNEEAEQEPTNRIINGHIVSGNLFISKINIETGEFISLDQMEAEVFNNFLQSFSLKI